MKEEIKQYIDQKYAHLEEQLMANLSIYQSKVSKDVSPHQGTEIIQQLKKSDSFYETFTHKNSMEI